MAKVKTIKVSETHLDENGDTIVTGTQANLSSFPNFSATGSVAGMKKLHYGEDALLVRCGSWIYNVSSEPWIYHELAS